MRVCDLQRHSQYQRPVMRRTTSDYDQAERRRRRA